MTGQDKATELVTEFMISACNSKFQEGVSEGRETCACQLAAWMAVRGYNCGEAGTVAELLGLLETAIDEKLNEAVRQAHDDC